MTISQMEREAKNIAYERLTRMGMPKSQARKYVNELYDKAIEQAENVETVAKALKAKKYSNRRAITVIVNTIIKFANKQRAESRKPYTDIFKEHIKDLKKRGYTFDFSDVDRMTMRELKYYSSSLSEFTKKYGTPPSDIIPDVVTKSKNITRRESWEKYKRDIAAYNKVAEKYHAGKFSEFKKDGSDYYVANWESYRKRPRRALRNIEAKNDRAFANFISAYDSAAEEGNKEAEWVYLKLVELYDNNRVKFIQVLNDSAAGKTELPYPEMFASTTQESYNFTNSFKHIYLAFGIEPYKGPYIDD